MWLAFCGVYYGRNYRAQCALRKRTDTGNFGQSSAQIRFANSLAFQ
jgi:hypothetical protein